MRLLVVRNVHEALPRGLALLDQIGVERDSRNGMVLYGGPVTTIYKEPTEKVCFWPERDCNPFFHLYEALWMLAGRNDVAPLTRYAKQMNAYSDDKTRLHGAYGYRWRFHFWQDQLEIIARTLKHNPDDRRCVLQMWDVSVDLGKIGKDFPCNTMATFQINADGKLDMHVFCRSNDIVWGAYGANAVHFGMLLEYMAVKIGRPIGTYTQISINWHGYLNTLEPLKHLRADKFNYIEDPYVSRQVHSVPMLNEPNYLDDAITGLLLNADSERPALAQWIDPWMNMVETVLYAHHLYKALEGSPNRFREPLAFLDSGDQNADWIVAAKAWLIRRWHKAKHRAEIVGYGQTSSPV